MRMNVLSSDPSEQEKLRSLPVYPLSQELNEQVLKSIGVGKSKIQTVLKKLLDHQVETWGELLGVRDMSACVSALEDDYGTTLWYMIQEYKTQLQQRKQLLPSVTPQRPDLNSVAAAAAAQSPVMFPKATPGSSTSAAAAARGDSHHTDDEDGGSNKKVKRTRDRPQCLECGVRSHIPGSECGLNWWIKTETEEVTRLGGEQRKDACRRLWPTEKTRVLARMAEVTAAAAKNNESSASTADTE